MQAPISSNDNPISPTIAQRRGMSERLQITTPPAISPRAGALDGAGHALGPQNGRLPRRKPGPNRKPSFLFTALESEDEENHEQKPKMALSSGRGTKRNGLGFKGMENKPIGDLNPIEDITDQITEQMNESTLGELSSTKCAEISKWIEKCQEHADKWKQ